LNCCSCYIVIPSILTWSSYEIFRRCCPIPQHQLIPFIFILLVRSLLAISFLSSASHTANYHMSPAIALLHGRIYGLSEVHLRTFNEWLGKPLVSLSTRNSHNTTFLTIKQGRSSVPTSERCYEVTAGYVEKQLQILLEPHSLLEQISATAINSSLQERNVAPSTLIDIGSQLRHRSDNPICRR
jgi:hypothetical protein